MHLYFTVKINIFTTVIPMEHIYIIRINLIIRTSINAVLCSTIRLKINGVPI